MNIRELIIVNDAGIAIFYQNFASDNNIDYQSIAVFFTALNTFANYSINDKINSIVLGKKIYYFVRKDNLNFIFRCDKKDFSENVLKSKAEKVVVEFYNKFCDVLKEFDGNISCFNSFSDKLSEILGISNKNTKPSSEILSNLIGFNKKVNYKKVLDSL
ncbi:MAG: hypothetical protein ACTSPY_01580 [Candidatus Helarchaeota archaeon]